MSFFGNIVDSIQSRFQESGQKKKEEHELLKRMRLQANEQRRDIFEQEFRKNALEVARAQAKKDAAEKSGLQKLRAMNRASRLTGQNIDQPSFLQRMGEYTQKNMAKRDENMKRTAELREAAKNMRVERAATQKATREQRMTNRTPFGG